MQPVTLLTPVETVPLTATRLTSLLCCPAAATDAGRTVCPGAGTARRVVLQPIEGTQYDVVVHDDVEDPKHEPAYEKTCGREADLH